MSNRYFVCVNGIIWTIFPDGRSNFNEDFKIEDDNLFVLGESCGASRLIIDEYSLWNSLVELAREIEGV